jgi:hypothetical protein
MDNALYGVHHLRLVLIGILGGTLLEVVHVVVDRLPSRASSRSNDSRGLLHSWTYVPDFLCHFSSVVVLSERRFLLLR